MLNLPQCLWTSLSLFGWVPTDSGLAPWTGWSWAEVGLAAAVVLAVVWIELRGRAIRSRGALQFASLASQIEDSVLIFDRKLRLISLNHQFPEMRGVPPIVGRTTPEIRTIFQFSSPGHSRLPLEQALLEGRSSHLQGTVHVTTSGQDIDVIASVAPLRDARQRIFGVIAVITDVSDMKARQARDLEQARHLAVAHLTAGLIHDFNHVLDVVQRAVAVLDLQADAEPRTRQIYYQMIVQATRAGAAIVQRLRDYLAGGGGEHTPVDLSRLAREAAELTRPLWGSRPEIEWVEDLNPELLVKGNASDLRQVVANLIFNALDALSGQAKGRVTVHTGTSRSGVVCWVEDSGPGPTLEAQGQLFQPYFTTKAQGLGLGLFAAQKIALAHGGDLRFSREPGGTRFSLELPALEQCVEALEVCAADTKRPEQT